MLKIINKIIRKIYNSKKRQKDYKPLYQDYLKLFQMHGEGLYIVCLRASPDNFVSKIIGMITGKMAHTFIMLYAEKLSPWMTEGQLNGCMHSVFNNYRFQHYWEKGIFTIVLPQHIKTLVLSSADSTGLECFDFSTYQNRQMSIRKIPATTEQCQTIISYLCNIIGRPYDFTGLIGWLFNCGDDAYSYYCSESVYDACISAGITIADHSDPSVDDIHNYGPTKQWIVYQNFIENKK